MPPKFPPPVPLVEVITPEVPAAAPPARKPRAPQKPRGKALVATAITAEETPGAPAPRERVDWGDQGLDELEEVPEFAAPQRVSLAPVARESPPRPVRASAIKIPAEDPKRPTRSREQARADFERWIASLPSPPEVLRGASAMVPDSSLWIPEFKQYMFALLAPIYPDLSTRRDALSDGFVRVFMRAFTDISFSSDDNETIEMLGDKILGLVFTQHLHSRVPSAGPSELTHYHNNYMSKESQADLATRLKMHEWILLGAQSAARRDAAVTTSMKEDVFESFFSSLYSVATQLHQNRLRSRQYEDAALNAVHGAEAARVLIDFIFDGVGIDPERGKDAAKSILIEVPKMYGLRRYGITFDPPSDGPVGAKHSVTISRALQTVLADVGFPGIPLVLAKDYPDKTSAAVAALKTLAEHGLDEQAMQDQKEITGIAKMRPEGLRDAVIAKARAMGFPKQLFEIPERSKQPDGTMLLVLIGVNDRDQRTTLASVTTSNFHRGKVDVAQLFLTAA